MKKEKGNSRNSSPKRSAGSLDRRSFFRQAAGAVVRAGAVGGAVAGTFAVAGSHKPEGRRGEYGILRPPGALDEREFLALCVRCTRCADACETQCIRFFGPDAGRLHDTPYIEPGEKGCNMCLECGKTCPTGAIKPLERMQDADMGVAVVDDRLCLPLAGRGVCGACHTVCPLRNRAITLDIRNAPIIHPEECTGCGLCEEICIVREPRAIRVRTERKEAARA